MIFSDRVFNFFLICYFDNSIILIIQRHSGAVTDNFFHAGPMSATLVDFWRMIWQYKVSAIVMLTKCTEESKACSTPF